MRKIIHCDCDCFYAAVEMRDSPELRGRPIAVGGAPDARGVIATCSYEARQYGIRSAMSSAQAAKLCPDLIFIRPDIKKYQAVSKQINEIMQQYTPLIEPVSLDEAYLDVTSSSLCNGSATLMAEDIRKKVKRDIGITLSAGVAPNKFLAKVASDWNKPDGVYVIRPQDVSRFVVPLDVSKINGVGKVTAAKLKKIGVNTCGDLQRYSQGDLVGLFGKYGERLYHVARGIDHREVEPFRIRKSVSVERTFSKDIQMVDSIVETIPGLVGELERRCKNKVGGDREVVKRIAKVKFFDFTQTTLEQKVSGRLDEWCSEAAFRDLIISAWRRKGVPVRLLGIGVRLADKGVNSATQLSLL